jgi:hypothetical protein
MFPSVRGAGALFFFVVAAIASASPARAGGFPACARDYGEVVLRFTNRLWMEKEVVLRFRDEGLLVSTTHWQNREWDVDYGRLRVGAEDCIYLATAGIGGTDKLPIYLPFPDIKELLRGNPAGKMNLRTLSIGCHGFFSAIEDVLAAARQRATSIEPAGTDKSAALDCARQVLLQFEARLNALLTRLAEATGRSA